MRSNSTNQRMPSGVKTTNDTKISNLGSNNVVVNVQEEQDENKSSVNETKVGRKYFQVKILILRS